MSALALRDPKLVALLRPDSAAAEPFRIVQANLRFLGAVRELKRVLVSSAFPGEGKTLVAANLAAACAEAGQRVLLLDADLRNPGTHRLFGLPSTRGLTSVLEGDRTLDAVCYLAGRRLTVCPAGPVPPNSAELLGSEVMAEVLGDAARRYDLVLIDGPPVLLLADALLLAAQADGVLMVVRAGQTRRRDAARALESLTRAQARVVGVVLDRVRERAPSYRYGGYYGGGGRRPERGSDQAERVRRPWAKPNSS